MGKGIALVQELEVQIYYYNRIFMLVAAGEDYSAHDQ